MELLWLLLPVAAASGWWAARRERAVCKAPLGNPDYIERLDHLLADKPDQTLERFFRLVEVDRDTADTHLALGNLFRRRGEVERAVSVHSHLIAKTTLTAQQRSRAVLELGEDYMRAGLFDRAEALFRELTEQPDYTAVALARLVDIYERQKDWQQAIGYCDRLEGIIGQSKKVETAHYCCELAEEAWQRTDHAAAQEWLQQALLRDRQCARASILRGRIALASGCYTAAIAAFQAVERQSRSFFPEVLAFLSPCYAALERQAELIAYLRDVQERDHTGRVTVVLAELLLHHQGEKVALRFLETELQDHPTLLGLRRLVELKLARAEGGPELKALYRVSQHLLNDAVRYRCEQCGFVGKFLHWHCPSCKRWSSVKPLPDLLLRDPAG